MKRIAITGASGSIGTHLAEVLLMSGHTVVQSENALRIENQDYFNGFENPSTIDVLYHLAAKSNVPDSWNNPTDFFETNIIGTANALEFCKKHGVKMVFISSYMYGVPEYLPIDEKHAVKALNPYAFSKLEGERLCQFYTENFAVDSVIVRPFNIYGDTKNSKMLIPEIIHQIENSETINVKDLDPKRDYLHIADFIDFLVKIGDNINGEIYNVGSGSSYSVKEIIEACQKVWGSNLKVVSEDVQRPNEIPNTVCDISKVKRDLDWEPKLDLQEGLLKMKNQIKSKL